MALELSTTKENFSELMTTLGEDLAGRVWYIGDYKKTRWLHWKDSSGDLVSACLTLFQDRPLLAVWKGQDVQERFLDWEFARDMGVVREA